MSHETPAKPARSRRSALATALALLAITASAVALPGAATPAAAASTADASELCTGTRVTGDEMPEGPDPHPLIADLMLQPAWDLSTGEDVRVAVVDSGVDARHPVLDENVIDGTEFNTVYGDLPYEEYPTEWQHDCEGHGTGVAGLIAAERTEGDRMAGVAPDATIYPVRIAETIGDAHTDLIAEAIHDAVEHGARVINLSFADTIDREPIREAIQRAIEQDIVVVAAAGNDGYTNVPMYPAAYDGVLAVGSVDANSEPADSSNAGDWVDLAGIGEEVVLVAPGGEGYRVDSGTSFAAPQVSGAAALVRSLFPDMPAEEVAERLIGSATPLGGRDNDQTGAGLVDPYGALTYMGGPGNGTGDGGEEDGEAAAGRIPVRPLPQDEPMLSSGQATGLAVSGGLLLAVLLGLLAAPGVRRAARRGWRPGTAAPGQSSPQAPPDAPGPPAASLAWLGESGVRNQTPNRNRTR